MTGPQSPIAAVEGNAATNVTVANYSGNPAGITASIDWGDGSLPDSGTFTSTAVQGTHSSTSDRRVDAGYALPRGQHVALFVTDR